MPKPNALIEGILNLSSKLEEIDAKVSGLKTDSIKISFEKGKVGYLDLKNPRGSHWGRILDRLLKEKRTVYVEIDPDTSIITQLLVPQPAMVHSLEPNKVGNIVVKLLPSHALHFILQNNPDFEDLRKKLQSAKSDKLEVLVTETRDDHEIIDVQIITDSAKRILSPSPKKSPEPPPDPPVTPARATELFNLMNSKTCPPPTSPAPCIPFMFPDDGCYARAHEMCRLMFAEGESPEKVWIYGSLVVQTANSPYCSVGWWYHVAPTLTVTTPTGDEKWVIDPSLCTEPKPVQDWKNLQGDPAATLEYTDATQFGPGGTTDPDYSLTNYYLQEKRDLLIDRCLEYGSPPYACPIIKACSFIVDRNTFAKDEIDAMLLLANPAIIDSAFYVTVDGFSPDELGITAATLSGIPNIKPTINVAPVPVQMSIEVVHLDVEDPVHLNRRQRLTWTYRVLFTGTNAFVDEIETVTLTASISTVSANAYLYLIRQPNPYEVDGSISWLSTDLRVFQIKEGESKFGVPVNNNPANFITQVISNLNSGITGGQTYEHDISTDQQTSKLELSQTVGGLRVYNFAVARVRYRALSTPAQNVRVFFRLFPASSTSLDYNSSTTYRRGGQGGVVIPLLGIQGGEVITIPCFASARVDSSTTNLNAQADTANVQTMPANASGNEVIRYFGCWLDFNQTQPQFPINPIPVDGPYVAATRKTIQELVRNRHQCLVSEIAFDLAPILAGATPSSSDKLAQRNLAIVESDNPGSMASHRIPHTFEIRPTRIKLAENEIPDELMINWGNIPVGSLATIFLNGTNTNEILKMALNLYRSSNLIRVDENTIQCITGGITYIPIPKGEGANFTGMITIDLPSTVVKGQVFTAVIHQVTSGYSGSTLTHNVTHISNPRLRRILGSFQITIPVSTKDAILEPEARLLSNLRWIKMAIPENNRWFKVFNRYENQIANRVDALGGNSTTIVGSPSDDSKNTTISCKLVGILIILLLAFLVVVLGILTGTSLTSISSAVVLLIAGLYTYLRKYCKPTICCILMTIIIGFGIGALILAILLGFGYSTPQLIRVLGASAAIAILATISAWMKGCFKK